MQKKSSPTNIRDMALKCLYLNRTSFSGVLHPSAGPIGGQAQAKWTIGCRFNREKLSRRILELSKLSNRVKAITCQPWLRVCQKWQRTSNTLLYLDPPFVEVLHLFSDLDYKQEFNKLVRDKIPSNIERGGEVVSKARLVGEPFLRALREKLAEEAFEVLDASDQDSIVAELADVTEVIDAILALLKVSRDELIHRQKEKRQKAGGFEDGIVLLKTSNPLPTNKNEDAEQSLLETESQIDKISHKVEKWSDRREHPAVSETKIKLEVPIVMDNWSSGTSEATIDKETGIAITAKLTGKRVKSTSIIEISIFQNKQLNLFK